MKYTEFSVEPTEGSESTETLIKSNYVQLSKTTGTETSSYVYSKLKCSEQNILCFS